MATDEAAFDKFVTAFIEGFGDRARAVAEQQAADSQHEAARSSWAAIAASVRKRQADAILSRQTADHAGRSIGIKPFS